MLFASFCLLCAVIVNTIAYNKLLQNTIVDIPLNDIAHNNLPILSNYHLNDVFIVLLTIYTLYKLESKHIERYSIILSLLFIIRAISFSVTHLPSPNVGCNKRNIHNTCNDLMFSGHTTLLTVSLMALYYWGSISLSPLVLYYLMTITTIILPRKHYTVDILIASVLSCSIFYNLMDN
jgi:hypothetical protein